MKIPKPPNKDTRIQGMTSGREHRAGSDACSDARGEVTCSIFHLSGARVCDGTGPKLGRRPFPTASPHHLSSRESLSALPTAQVQYPGRGFPYPPALLAPTTPPPQSPPQPLGYAIASG